LARSQITEDTTRKDIRSIGLIMIELMDQLDSALHRDELKVSKPERWVNHPNILEFLADTDSSTLEELLNHSFIPKSSDFSIFSSWVLLTQMNAYIENDSLFPKN
jgi:hypothetical protein